MTEQHELQILRIVADAAAQSVIDLNRNLSDAYAEYMAGAIPNGAYQYVLGRHGNLLTALNTAGYTEMHPLFQFPIKPKK